MYRRFVIASLLLGLVLMLSSQTIAQINPLAPCTDALTQYAPVTGTDRYPTPANVLPPPPREAYIDPTYGTCVVRVTDRLNDFDNPQVNLKNEYSRVQGFNADGSLIMVYGGDSGDWFLYDAQTLQPIQRISVNLSEPRWDASNPYRFTFSRWFDLDLHLYVAELAPEATRFNIRETAVHNFAGELPTEWNTAVVWHRWEGSPSNDSRYDAFMAEDEDFVTRGLVSYDWQDDEILGLYSVPSADMNEPDNVGMSPSGDYVMAQFECCPEGQLGTYDAPCGGMVYDRKLTQGWGISRCIAHNDMTWDTQGNEVIVHQEIDTDQIVMTELATGKTTPLLELDFSGGVYGLHISGRASDQPGWVAVSVHPEAVSPDWSNPFWMVGTIYALELAPDPRVVQLAHHHTLRDESAADAGYFAEAHVSVNQDFTRLLFTSNWDQAEGTNEVDMYMIALPDHWIDLLP